MPQRQKIVPLDTFNNEMEAQMMAQILEEYGIPAVIQPMGGGYGALGVTQFIPHRLFVPEEDFDRAKEIADTDYREINSDSPETSAP
ncbi:MAG: hypothetical protein BZY79_00525 [SAR202 cluster bacterium Casp-Chloro-G4]|nr:DUF2007 domain-containing protein [Chloroflexota bacterium]MDA1226878.1 DUF2007 domain-containing protein [Chloroflexota bacterium]PKB62086.1 MAG: hypothetical protein BZY79_00525 [SAR202 cluster bacterium Casp-Chloro-G4]